MSTVIVVILIIFRECESWCDRCSTEVSDNYPSSEEVFICVSRAAAAGRCRKANIILRTDIPNGQSVGAKVVCSRIFFFIFVTSLIFASSSRNLSRAKSSCGVHRLDYKTSIIRRDGGRVGKSVS